ncbi:MAG TPA: c-type cytochrome [Sphingobacteriaceae bacterium]|nr:c-type cytochrome [Sphingobacteriaceae bacterium]
MKQTIVFLMICAIVYGCGQSGSQGSTDSSAGKTAMSTEEYDPKRGEGKFDSVELEDQLDVPMATEGKLISDLKCASCHKYTDERLVGPGWEGVTSKHRPEWIMNFITNPDPMIDKDPELQAQLEICLVRMPNQNLSDDDARAILEFMRQNDGLE